MAYPDQADKKEATRVVEMLVQTVHRHNGNLYRLWPGRRVEVPESLAVQWADGGIAKPAGNVVRRHDVEVSKVVPRLSDHRAMQDAERYDHENSAPRQEVLRTDLRIAANHGDVSAMRRLDRMGDPETRPTNEPIDLTDEGAPGVDEAEDENPSPPTPEPGDRVQPTQTPRPINPPTATPRTTTGASARQTLGGGGKG